MMKMTDPLADKVRDYCRKWDMLPQGGTVLCAVSGGRDSMALLHLLSEMAGEIGFQVAAGHFNHQLRDTADRDEAFVRDWCRKHGIPFTRGQGDVRAFAGRNGLGIEDAARTLRYAFLESAARDLGADRIAAAHHRDDNAETLLLHLIRGSGMQGLGGIPPVRGMIVRPLLDTGRDEINGYVARNHIPFVEDETNQDAAYTRNRVRLEVLPLLESIAPGCTGRIAGTAALAREENAYIQRKADELLPLPVNGAVTLPVSLLEGQDQVLRRRLVRAMAQRLGESLSLRQTEAVLGLGSGGFLDLSGGLCAVRTKRDFIIKRREPPPVPSVLRGGTQIWGNWQVTVERRSAPADESPFRVSLRDTGEALTVSAWDGSGRLYVGNGYRTIKRLFADHGIPAAARGEYPAILANGRTIAVFGAGTDWNRRPAEGEAAVVITLLRVKHDDSICPADGSPAAGKT